jgi:hypothetical protein
MIQVERLDDRVDIIRPQLRVIVAVVWLVRETMTSHIQRDQTMLLRKGRVHLAIPLEPTLRGTVDEEDRATLWVSRFHYMQVYAPTACHSVSFHHDPRLRISPSPPPLSCNSLKEPGEPKLKASAWVFTLEYRLAQVLASL